MIAVDIGIPVYNEEKNIENLLEDIRLQTLPTGFKLNKILVISDRSTDKTHELVSNFPNLNKKVKLIIKNIRTGKRKSLELLFRISSADVMVLFDGDIRLEKDTLYNLTRKFANNKNLGLVAGNPIPVMKYNTIGEKASYFSWVLISNIKRYNSNSIYCVHGRIVAMSRKLFKNLKLLRDQGDDQSLYIKCKQKKLKMVYSDKSKVYYNIPIYFSDYLKQRLRFRTTIRQKSQILGKYIVKREFTIKNKFRIVVNSIISHPLYFLYWLFFYLFSNLLYIFLLIKNNRVTETWEISQSTK